MEINPQEQPFAVSRHRSDRTLAGQSLSPDTVVKLQNETAERTRLVTVEQGGGLARSTDVWENGHAGRRAQGRTAGFQLERYWCSSE